MISLAQRRLFGTLIRGADLAFLRDLLISPRRKHRLTIRYRLLTNRSLFRQSLAVLEYWFKRKPFCDVTRCFGRIDFAQTLDLNRLAVRGWLFFPNSRIGELTLILDGIEYPVQAFTLPRQDVSASFGYFRESNHSGFVAIFHQPPKEPGELIIGFRVLLTDGERVQGSFEAASVENMPSAE